MHPDVRRVADLQTTDREIARLSAEVAALPRHIQVIEAKLAGALRQLEADRQALVENQKERRRMEGDIPVQQEKISKYKGQMFDVKTNEQYKALQHEIEFAEGEIRKIEDRILERMVFAEELEVRVKTAEQQLAAEKTAVENEKAEAKARTRADQAALAELAARRDALRHDVPADVLAEYDKLMRHRRGIAVAEVRDGTCTECNVRLRPQRFQELKPNDKVMLCESCGRIQYYAPPPVEQQAPADEQGVAGTV